MKDTKRFFYEITCKKLNCLIAKCLGMKVSSETWKGKRDLVSVVYQSCNKC